MWWYLIVCFVNNKLLAPQAQINVFKHEKEKYTIYRKHHRG